MNLKESGSPIYDSKDLEVNIDIKAKVKIIYLLVAPETFETPEIDFDVISSPISVPFDLFSQQRAKLWVDWFWFLFLNQEGKLSKEETDGFADSGEPVCYIFPTTAFDCEWWLIHDITVMQTDPTENMDYTGSVWIH